MIVSEYEYWDLGEEDIIRLTDKPLSSILRALVQCEGQITCTHCIEKDFHSTKLKYANRNCTVVFRIKLPQGLREEFELLSGFSLTTPPKLGV